MPMTEVLYTGRYYRAEVIHHPVKGDSLVVSHVRKRGGKQMPDDLACSKNDERRKL